MSLKSIRASIASDTGYHPDTSTDDKVLLDREINNVCADIYNKNDLVGSIFELISYYDLDSHLVSFPWYVGDIRGARYYDSPQLITLRDVRPRYGTNGYGVELMDFREVGVSSLWIQNDEYSVLKFSLPEGEVETVNIVIKVVGETPVAAQVEETVTILAGEQFALSVNNWIGAPRVIEKAAPNNFDITITDIENVELAIIPNSELRSMYSIWQVQDDNIMGTATPLNAIEILYKERFKKLVNEYDEFLHSRYDEVIKWKWMEEYYAKMEGKESQKEMAAEQWMSKMGAVNRNKSKGKKAELQTVPNKFYGIFNRLYYRNGTTYR